MVFFPSLHLINELTNPPPIGFFDAEAVGEGFGLTPVEQVGLIGKPCKVPQYFMVFRE